jgi:uncharacterized membrane-anchored protein YjiN (DUF445 family)
MTAPALDDATRQRNLDTMKRRATALLVVAGILYVAAKIWEPIHPAIGFVRAAAEAGVIGGLADWFAVTALFRHPLGIPIPHTAILPTRKERLGRTLGNFVQNHFLSREVVSKRLQSFHVAERAAKWMSEPDNSRRIAKQVAAGLARAVEHLPEEEMQRHLHDAVVKRLRSMQVAPMLGTALSLVREGNKHQEILNEVVRLAGRTVSENRDLIRDRVKEESPWWVPGIVDEQLYRKIVIAIDRLLADIGSDPDHPLRTKFDQAIEQFIVKLQRSPEVIAKAESIKEKLLDDPMVTEATNLLWDSIRRAAVSQAARVEDGEAGPLGKGIAAFGHSLTGNAEMLAQIDRMVVDLAVAAVEQYRGEVADLIAQTVAGWDPIVTSRRIELAIGKDLQFIRINGTLVGALVGLVMHLVTVIWR